MTIIVLLNSSSIAITVLTSTSSLITTPILNSVGLYNHPYHRYIAAWQWQW